MNEQPGAKFDRLGRGRVLFLCDRAVPDPAVGSVAAEMGYELVRASSLDEAMAHARPPGFALILAGYSGNAGALFDSVRRLRAALPARRCACSRACCRTPYSSTSACPA